MKTTSAKMPYQSPAARVFKVAFEGVMQTPTSTDNESVGGSGGPTLGDDDFEG
ncbi:MAG: hypothetical protein IKX26_07940 [Bacteroidales bacterium]|nr:hypothetical protein [Bacteroidales bacterium]